MLSGEQETYFRRAFGELLYAGKVPRSGERWHPLDNGLEDYSDAPDEAKLSEQDVESFLYDCLSEVRTFYATRFGFAYTGAQDPDLGEESW